MKKIGCAGDWQEYLRATLQIGENMNITQRELEVLKLLCLQDKEISKRLIISVRTVKCHIHNILNKLVCETRQKALIKALKLKIIDIDEVEG